MKIFRILNFLLFFGLFIPFSSIAQITKSNVKTTPFKSKDGLHSCEIIFTLKGTENNSISTPSLVQFIFDSTDVIQSACNITKYNKEEWDDINRFVFVQGKIEKAKKTSILKIDFYIFSPFVINFSKVPKDKVFTHYNGMNIFSIGPFQSDDSLNIVLEKWYNHSYDINRLRDEAAYKESLKYKKAEYEKYLDSMNVLAIIAEGIRNGDITNQNSKSGATLNLINKNLNNKFSNASKALNPYFDNDEFQNFNIKYSGSISPLTGILQCRRRDVLLTEYKIVDSSVTALRVFDRYGESPTGELIIDLENNKFKAFSYINEYSTNWLSFYEGSLPNPFDYNGFCNIVKIRKYLYVYDYYGKNNVDYTATKISRWNVDGEISKQKGIWISEVTHKELTDELSNSDILLSRKTPVKYVNKNNKEFDYFHLEFNTNDSISSVSKIGELVGGKKYLQTYYFTKSSFLKEFYKNLKIDSTISEFEIAANKWKSLQPTTHIPLFVHTKRKSDSIYSVIYQYNNKKLFEANMNIKSQIVGEAKIYSISSPLQKQYITTRKNDVDRLNSIFKISFSFVPVKNEYTSQLSSLISLVNFNPNDDKTIGLPYLYVNLMPLATSPLGTEISLNGNPAFVDRTQDYLAQRAIFNHGKLEALYVYLPNGECFDSINLRLNEYGEQIGKSSINEFPFSDRYMSLYNQSQKELEERQTQAMLLLLQKLKENDNICDHCKKNISDSRIDIYDIDCPNGKSYMLDSKRKFCSLKCHSEYKKYWCDLQDN